MTTINGGSLALVDSFLDTDTTLLANAIHLASWEIGGTTYIYASSENGDAIEIFTLSDGGALTNVGQITDSGGLALDRPWEMKTFEVDGNPFLAVAAAIDDGITLFSISNSAPFLTFADSMFQSEDVNLNLDRAYGLDVVETNSGTFLYVAGYVSNGFSSFSVASNGTLTSLANVDDDGALAIAGAIDVVAFQRGNSNYIAVAGYDAAGLTVFFVGQSGILSPIDSLEGLPAADGVWEMAGTSIGTENFFYLPGTNANSISVVGFNGNTLREVQSIQSSTGLAGVRASEVIEIGDSRFLAVLEEFGADLQLFEIETNSLTGEAGSLNHIQTIVGPTFNASGGLHTVVVGDTPYLVSGSGNNGAINVLAIGGSDDALDGTQSDDVINGFAGDDLIRGLAGNDVIDGGDDTDIIFAGSGQDTVIASSGEDRSNGGSNFDTFDARSFDNEGGVTIDLFNERFTQSDGTRQFITDFERLYGTNLEDELIGNEKNNDLRGGSSADTLRGREGNDSLRGQNGVDTLIGGDGDDFLFGGAGNDAVLNGGNGNDTLDGEDGDDGLYGGSGNDSMQGGSGNDILRGNGGWDVMAGGGGDDDLRGANGNDTLFGNGGSDVLLGEDGDDLLNAGSGSDSMFGGSGDDVFEFRTVAAGGGGYNAVKDFTNGQDQLDLSSYGLTFAQVNALTEQRSWGSRIEFDDGQVIGLEGFDKVSFDASDVIL